MNTTRTGTTQDGVDASEVDSQMAAGPSGTTKLAPRGETATTVKHPIFQ